MCKLAAKTNGFLYSYPNYGGTKVITSFFYRFVPLFLDSVMIQPLNPLSLFSKLRLKS